MELRFEAPCTGAIPPCKSDVAIAKTLRKMEQFRALESSFGKYTHDMQAAVAACSREMGLGASATRELIQASLGSGGSRNTKQVSFSSSV